jgi:toxin ParE1/3/4
VIIRWTPTALRDLDSLYIYIAEDNESAAAAMVDAIGSALAILQRHPELGRQGRVAGTRELIVAPYVVAYRARRASIDVLAVIHSARRWPDSFK